VKKGIDCASDLVDCAEEAVDWVEEKIENATDWGWRKNRRWCSSN